MNVLNQVLRTADGYLSVLHTNKYVGAGVSLFLVLYAGLAAPSLPASVAALFENPLFKLAVLTLVLVTKLYNVTISLLVAIGFVISMQTLSKYRIFTMANELSNVAGNVADVAQNVVGGVVDVAQNVVGGVVDAVSDVLTSNESFSESSESSEGESECDSSKPQPGNQMSHFPPAAAGAPGVASLPFAIGQQGPQGHQAVSGFAGNGLAPIGGPGSQL